MEWRDVWARVRARLESTASHRRARVAVAGALVAGLALAGLGFAAGRRGSSASPPGAEPASAAVARRASAPANESVPTTAADVVVAVAGAVVRPGIVTLAVGARVVDAIDAAGGATHDADPNALDLAAKLTDGERVYVPKRGEHVDPMPTGDPSSGGAGSSAGGAGSGTASSTPVDLNTASQAQLEALPGIGPTLAQAIIAARTRLGGFRSVDDLREVHGIGERRFADLRRLVTV